MLGNAQGLGGILQKRDLTAPAIIRGDSKSTGKNALTPAGARLALTDLKEFKWLSGKVDLYRNVAEYLADPKANTDDKSDIKRESSVGGSIEGFYSARNRRIGLFIDNIKDANRMKVVMASHETYHAFMDIVLGTQAARQFHLSVWNEFKNGGNGIVGVQKFAEKHGLDPADIKREDYDTDEDYRKAVGDRKALAAEEWIAKHAENGKFTEAGLKGLWNKIVAIIRRGWLKIHPTAKLTDNDVAFMLRGTVGAKIREANQWAMQGKENIPAPMFRPYQDGISKLEKHFKQHPEAYGKFSIDTAGANLNDPADVARAAKMWAEMGTESPYFKRWFGDSKVVDANGKPLVVYHGTPVSHPFSLAYPILAEGFRETNSRRNTLPGSHPFEVKGGAPTEHLRKPEQLTIYKKLRLSYAEYYRIVTTP